MTGWRKIGLGNLGLRNLGLRWAVAGGLAVAAGVFFAMALMPGRTAHADKRETRYDQLSYASPLEMLFSPDGKRLYVLCQGTDEIRVLDAATYAETKRIAVGHVPRGFSLSPQGDRLYVTNSWDDTLSVIDTETLSVVSTWAGGGWSRRA